MSRSKESRIAVDLSVKLVKSLDAQLRLANIIYASCVCVVPVPLILNPVSVSLFLTLLY